jgi:hypothetical protein
VHPYRYSAAPEERRRPRTEDVVGRHLCAVAKVFVVAWIVFRGAVAVYQGGGCPDLYLGAAVLLVLVWSRR